MSETNDDPLYVGDITGAPKSADAVRQELDEQRESMLGSPSDAFAIQSMEDSAVVVRLACFGVLNRLVANGVEEAAILTDRLEDIDPKEKPLEADLSTLASMYDEERLESDDPVDQRRLKSLGSLAHAAWGISVAQAVRAAAGESSSHIVELIYVAEEAVTEADVSDEARVVLKDIVAELKLSAGIPPESTEQ